MKGNDRIFVALDGGMSSIGAIELMEEIGKGQVAGVKANDLLDTCLVQGYRLPELVKELGRYAPMFWADQKFSDVANTVGNRVSAYRNTGVDLITVMAGEGVPMIRKAIEVVRGEIGIIGVTVLTDKKEEEAHLNLGGPTRVKVLQYATNIVLAGGRRVVCSGQELKFLKQFPELDLLERYVPAVRSLWAAAKGQDKSRIITPTLALQNGADYIVIGSPIYDPPKEVGTPADAVQRILEEIEQAEIPEING